MSSLFDSVQAGDWPSTRRASCARASPLHATRLAPSTAWKRRRLKDNGPLMRCVAAEGGS